MRIATISMTSTADKSTNIKEAKQLINQAVEWGAEWILLPEIFAYHGPYKQLEAMAEDSDGQLISELQKICQNHKICLFAGTIGELSTAGKGQGRVHNTLHVIDRSGNIVGKYRKIHLFNLIDANGSKLYCEEDGFIPGDQPLSIHLDGWHVGLSICYDLRFPELYAHLASSEALDMIVVPSAFTQQTGMDHWEVLLRARAIEQQCYVFAANQVGEHSPGKRSYGHSMIVDPWGHKLADTGDRPGLAMADVTKSRITEVRSILPALANKCLGYPSCQS